MIEIRKILVANRGEIALRIMRTCRRMGIDTVAVFSDADADAPHVHAADEAVRIGPPPADRSYLDVEAVLAAAARTGADAVHPGYGFLAENAAFAEACADRGLVFIGPAAEVVRLLGSKRAAKEAAVRAGVPVVPGYAGEERDEKALVARARELGFPVLLKASAGGGGKGMRLVREVGEMAAAVDAARREALGAFGDDTLLIEKYVDRPRHIEIQILGDRHGNVVHLYERECSIQRRHQKIIEESPAVDEALRARMGAAAVALAKAVGYENAGTVEFILAPDGSFYFLEVNTRLQVEHPVTECITGLDLVREQIRVARGEALDMDALAATPISGAAIECRLYAEDPESQFLPTSGRIVDWHLPAMEGMRVDAGVAGGQEVSIHYDPMLAKLICHAPTRDQAIGRMHRYLREMAVQGIVTNRALLIRVLGHLAFRARAIDTHFIERHADALLGMSEEDSAARATRQRHAAIAATLAAHEQRRAQRSILPALAPGFRNSRFADEQVDYRAGDATVAAITGDDAAAVAAVIRVRYRNLGRGRFRFAVAVGQAEPAVDLVTLVRCEDPELVFEHVAEDAGDGLGLRQRRRVVRDGARWLVHGLDGDVVLVEQPRFPDASDRALEGGCIAPMPGKVVEIMVAEGASVAKGDTLLVLEAMKMEHPVKAPEGGVVAQVAVAKGDQVDAGQLLAVVTAAA